MTPSSDTELLERRLHDDLSALRERLTEDKFAGEVYRSVAGVAWSRPGTGAGHVTLSWKMAERLVNELRGDDADELTLAQTGGEGEVSDDIAAALGELGWTAKPADTSRDDPQHATQHTDTAPPADAGVASAPEGSEPQAERFAEAHVEADENARRDE